MSLRESLIRLDQTTSSVVDVEWRPNWCMPLWWTYCSRISLSLFAGGPESPFNGQKFIQDCQRILPEAVLSLGWTTGSPAKLNDLWCYSGAMVDKMLALCDRYAQRGTHITFPLQITYAYWSWRQVERLLARQNAPKSVRTRPFTTTITLWGTDDHGVHKWIMGTQYYADSRIYVDIVVPNPSPAPQCSLS